MLEFLVGAMSSNRLVKHAYVCFSTVNAKSLYALLKKLFRCILY